MNKDVLKIIERILPPGMMLTVDEKQRAAFISPVEMNGYTIRVSMRSGRGSHYTAAVQAEVFKGREPDPAFRKRKATKHHTFERDLEQALGHIGATAGGL